MRAGTWTRSIAAGAAAVARRQLFHAPRSSRQSPIPQPKTASAPEPLGFEPNLGQAGPEVRFVAWEPGFQAELHATSAVLVWRPKPTAPPTRLHVRFAGGRTPRTVGVRDELPGRSHYFAGADPSRWRTDVPQYAAVEYAEIYPGVDLVFHAQPGALRHDFVVSVTGTHNGRAQGSRVWTDGFNVVGAPEPSPSPAPYPTPTPLPLPTLPPLPLPTPTPPALP